MTQQQPGRGIDALIPPTPISIEDVATVALRALVIQAREHSDDGDNLIRRILEDVITGLDETP